MKNNILFITVCSLFFAFTANVNAQEDSTYTKNYLYYELGGNCIFMSMNYEREIISNADIKLGVGIVPVPYALSSKRSTISVKVFPVASLMATYKLQYPSLSSHSIEFGMGVLVIVPTVSIGYTFSPIDGGAVFKLFYTSFFTDSKFYSWAGIGIGTRF